MHSQEQTGFANGAIYLPSLLSAMRAVAVVAKSRCGLVGSFGRQGLSTRLKAYLLACLLLALATLSCAPSKGQNLKASPAEAWQALSSRAANHGFTELNFKLEPLPVYAMLKCSSPANELVVYIEGDGQSSLPSGRPSSDPTPITPYAFELASLDPAPCLLYLARPGQYYQGIEKPNSKYWTSARYSPEMLEALTLAINQAKQITKSNYLHLAGYSGGGTMATLLAEQRHDVLSLSSVAAVLDTDFWTKNGHYKPLTGSLNPADNLAALENLPQIHFAGLDDTTVPPAVFEHFNRLAHLKEMQLIYKPADHASAWWIEEWPNLLRQHVQPMRKASSLPNK